MIKKHRVTKTGHAKLIKEQKELRYKRRPKALKRLQRAREMGDLSENSEYQSAKEELAFLDRRIQEVEEMLRSIEIVGSSRGGDVIELGCSVTVRSNGEELTYHMVGEMEANITKNKLSEKSPIGGALIGKKKGQKVRVKIPAGNVQYEIIDIKH